VIGQEIRLNKFISDSGFCSRREADKLIEKKRVKINGETPELGTKVQQGDIVTVDGHLVKPSAKNKSDRIYIAYNKPIGITCTTESHVRGNIIAAIGHNKRIFPIGRLDKPSEGLIFLTSDGDIVNKILRAENAHDKEYIVSVDKPISERFITRMSKGVPILGTITKPCIVTMKSKFTFSIILTQGLNRQIRRMCEYLDYEVETLKRSRIMNITLGSLKPGQWRDLTIAEMADINNAVANSTKTANGEADPQFEDSEFDDIEDSPFEDVEETKSPIDTSNLDFSRGKSNKLAIANNPTPKSKTKLSLNKNSLNKK
jgi:pseudouridine synthase